MSLWFFLRDFFLFLLVSFFFPLLSFLFWFEYYPFLADVIWVTAWLWALKDFLMLLLLCLLLDLS